MSKMLRVAPDMKGELSLPIRKSSFKPNTLVELTDDEYRRREVQLALSLGFLKEIEPPKKDLPKVAVVTKPKLKSKTLPSDLDDEDVDDGDMEDMEDIEVKEPEVKTKKFKKLIRQKEMDLENNMGGWDPESQELLDENGSRKKALGNINSVEMDVQIGKNLDFKNDETETKIMAIPKKTRTKKSKVKTKKKKTTKKKITAKNSITPVGKKKELREYLDLSDSEKPDGVLAFVDEEDKQRRIAQHPILSKKLAKQNEEIG